MAGAPKGNTNAVKGKLFHDSLKRALARSNKTVDGGLNKVCDQLVQAAQKGEQWAVQMVADRMDGKAAQQIDMSIEQKTHEEYLRELDD